MTTKYNLDNAISDDGFYNIIKERLEEWNGDLDDQQFTAIWSAADYRIKYYCTLKDKKERIDALMDLFKERGLTPQYGISGPPTIQVDNIRLSPKGDLAISDHDTLGLDGEPKKHYVTIYLTGEMRPFFMISPELSNFMEYGFSNNSRYLIILNDNSVDVWDIFAIKKMSTHELSGSDRSSLIRWSSDNKHAFIQTNTKSLMIEIDEITKFIDMGNLDKSYDAALSDDGRTLMLLNDNISFVDTNSSDITSLDFPIPYSGNSISFYQKGTFYILTGGCLIEVSPTTPPTILKDYRGQIELSMDWKWCIQDHYEKELRPEYRFREEITKKINDKIVMEHTNLFKTINRCVIEPNTMSYELMSDFTPLEASIGNKKPNINKKHIKKFIELNKIEPIDELNSGNTISVFRKGSISSIKLIKTEGSVKFYGYQRYNSDIITDDEIPRYVRHGILEDLNINHINNENWEQIDELSQFTDPRYGSLFTEINAPKTTGMSKIQFCCRCDENILSNLNWSKIDSESYNDILIAKSRTNERGFTVVNSDILFVYDGKSISAIDILDGNNWYSQINGTQYFNNNGGLCRLNKSTKLFDTILKKEDIENYSFITYQVMGDDEVTILPVEKDKNRIYYSIISNKITEIASVHNGTYACYSNKKLFYLEDGICYIVDVTNGNVLKSIILSDYDKWTIFGINDSNTISIAKTNIKFFDEVNLYHNTVSIDVARISYPDFNIDVFTSGHVEIDDLNYFSRSIDIKGNKIISLTSRIDGNITRPNALTMHLIKKDGVKNGNTLIPDVSRLHANITAVDENRYVMTTDGIYEDIKKGTADNNIKFVQNIKGWCPVMRLMDVNQGTMIRLNGSHNTEGQLYGVKNYMIGKDTNVIPLNDGKFIATEFVKGNSHVVISSDISKGKQFPESGPIHGIILDSTCDSLSVGLIETTDDRRYVIKKYQAYDHKMNSITDEYNLNVPIISENGLHYESYSDQTLVDYSYEGMVLKNAYCPKRPKFTAGRNSYGIYEHMPLIIPVKVNSVEKDVQPPCLIGKTMHDGSINLYNVKVILCTLYKGMVCNSICTDIAIPCGNNNINSIDELISIIHNDTYLLYDHERYILIQNVCEFKNMPSTLYPYRITVIDKNCNTSTFDSIGSPFDFLGMPISIHDGNIEYICKINSNQYGHCIFGKNDVIKLPENYRTVSLYCDGKISVSQNTDSNNNLIIITNGDIFEIIPGIHEINIVDRYDENDGTTHLISDTNYKKEDIIIPKMIKGAHITEYLQHDDKKTYKIGRNSLIYRSGLYILQ